jgi:hypothetical protein
MLQRRRGSPLSSIDLDHTDDVLPTDRADIDLAGTSHTGTDMATVIEQGVLLLTVADLAQIHLFVSDLPVADALAVSFAVLVAADIFVACLLLDEGALAVALVFVPVSIVGIAGGVLHGTAAVALAEDKVADVGGRRVGDVLAFAVVVALQEFAAVVLAVKGGIDGLGAGEGPSGLIALRCEEVVDQSIRTGE